jgi:hypothetical protein
MEKNIASTSPRALAISMGNSRYFTGKPCLNGHVSERMVSTKTCVDCKNSREKHRKQRVFSPSQIERKNELARQARLKNPEKFKEISRQNYHLHKEKRNKKSYEYVANRRKNEPMYALNHRIRSLINQSFKVKNLSKKSKTMQILGCSFDEFKVHIERQFCKGMTWENRSKWHLDHILPTSLANNEDDLIRLNHYLNLRPCWAKENIEKSSKILFLI